MVVLQLLVTFLPGKRSILDIIEVKGLLPLDFGGSYHSAFCDSQLCFIGGRNHIWLAIFSGKQTLWNDG